MGKRGKNIRSRKMILDALEYIDSPFSSIEMGSITGLDPKRVVHLLRDMDNVEKIPVDRWAAGVRCVYVVHPLIL